MLTSILFYNAVIFSSLLMLYLSLNFTRAAYFQYIAFSILFFISAVRYGIGTDYVNYQKIFELLSINELNISIEPLFYLINIFAIKLGFHFEFVVAVSSFLFIYPLVKCSDKNVSIWIVFYLLLYFYIASFNAVRQGIAISISCYALYNLFYSNDKKRYVIFILLASLFHYSALLGFIVIYIRKRALPIWLNIAVIVLLYYSILMMVPIILNSGLISNSKYAAYTNSQYIESVKLGSGVGFIINILPYFVMIALGKFLFNDVKKINLAINASLLMIVIKLLTLQFGILARLEYTFYFIFAVIFGELAYRYKKSHLNYTLFIYMVLWAVLQFELQLLNGAHEVLPYQSIFGTF
ncbi:EpsG family protein [Aeromonas media]|uniref:EpsG family protein n=1 Tax=Aeromonas media TaxID=651 RepID=A0AAE7AHX5_AERME|nr:EpsG family protein [Aeromonas media]QJT30071.1 EpsG family protein [Aeromonas media]